jgi:hypothetical protein
VFTPVFVVFDYIYMHNMSDNIWVQRSIQFLYKTN